MEVDEFIEATTKIEDYYDKEYTLKQRKIMYEEMKHLEIARYRKVCSAVIRRCKYLPKIVDFLEEEKNLPKQKEAQNSEKVYCDKCKGTGYRTYFKKIKNGSKLFIYQYAATCECNNAIPYKGWEISNKEHRSNFYIPSFLSLGFKEHE